MLVMLPSSMRRDRGVAFVAALPLVPQHAMTLDAVELQGDGAMYDVITLNANDVDALHNTTKQALAAATPRMHRTARNLERFALRPGMTLKTAVDRVREMQQTASASGDEAPTTSAKTRAEAFAKIESVAAELKTTSESIAKLRQALRGATASNQHEDTALRAARYVLEHASELTTGARAAIHAARDLTTQVPNAWCGGASPSEDADDDTALP